MYQANKVTKMTKFEIMREHIKAREEYFKIKYSFWQKMYGYFRMCFHSRKLIESATFGISKR
jgi:hypothetical protein